MGFRVSLNSFLVKNKTSELMLMDLIDNPTSFSLKMIIVLKVETTKLNFLLEEVLSTKNKYILNLLN